MKNIFVCVGTHTQQFDRLLKKIDEIAKDSKDSFFGQIGNSNYKPKNFECKKFLDEKEFDEKIRQSDFIIGHAGAGLILSAFSLKKKVIIVPRLKEFGEHTDSHQLDLANALGKKKKVLAVFDISKLVSAIESIENFEPQIDRQTGNIVKKIEEFLVNG